MKPTFQLSDKMASHFFCGLLPSAENQKKSSCISGQSKGVGAGAQKVDSIIQLGCIHGTVSSSSVPEGSNVWARAT